MSRHQRGAALLLVMWLILLLSGLVAGYAAAARIESLQGNGLARGTEAREAARAGVEYAAARLLDADPARRWASDGRDNRFAFDGAQVEIGSGGIVVAPVGDVIDRQAELPESRDKGRGELQIDDAVAGSFSVVTIARGLTKQFAGGDPACRERHIGDDFSDESGGVGQRSAALDPALLPAAAPTQAVARSPAVIR